MKFTLIYSILVFILTSFISNAQNLSERDYSDIIQSLIGGEQEVSVYGGRVDLVQGEFAFEIERAKKWKESIGQSLWYAQQLNKKAGVILILESNDEFKYLQQLVSTIQYAGLADKIQVYAFPQDFQELIDEKLGK